MHFCNEVPEFRRGEIVLLAVLPIYDTFSWELGGPIGIKNI